MALLKTWGLKMWRMQCDAQLRDNGIKKKQGCEKNEYDNVGYKHKGSRKSRLKHIQYN